MHTHTHKNRMHVSYPLIILLKDPDVMTDLTIRIIDTNANHRGGWGGGGARQKKI